MQAMPMFSGELSCGWNLFAGYTFNCNTCERDINHQDLASIPTRPSTYCASGPPTADMKKAALQRPLPFELPGAAYMPRAQKMATTAITGTTWPCHITHLRVCLTSPGAGS